MAQPDRMVPGLDLRRRSPVREGGQFEYLLAENNLVPLQTLLFSQAGGSSVFPPLAHQYVAQLFARHDQVDDAITEYEEALRLKPDFDQAHQELGVLLASHGKVDLALPHLMEAVRLRPDRPEAHRNLAVALAQLGRTAEAMKELREVLRLRPDDAEVRRALEAYDRRSGRSGK